MLGWIPWKTSIIRIDAQTLLVDILIRGLILTRSERHVVITRERLLQGVDRCRLLVIDWDLRLEVSVPVPTKGGRLTIEVDRGTVARGLLVGGEGRVDRSDLERCVWV
jgi:hypothetical protein